MRIYINLSRPSQRHLCPTLYQNCPSQDHMLVPALILDFDNFLSLVSCIYDCYLHLKVFPRMNVSWEFLYVFKNRFCTKKKLRCVQQPRFIHCNTPMQKLVSFAYERSRKDLESLTRGAFWSCWTSLGIQLVHIINWRDVQRKNDVNNVDMSS